MWEEIGGVSPAALRAHAPTYRRWLLPRLTSGRLWGYVAGVRGGEIGGSGCLWLREAQPRPGEVARFEPYILSMYTVPACRGRGVATAIVRRFLAECRAATYARVVLHGSVFGRPVYGRLGFERTWEMRTFLDPARARRRREERAHPGATTRRSTHESR